MSSAPVPHPVPLSVLDLSPVRSGHPASTALRDSVDLARAVEGFGYRRFWVAEHHNSPGVVSAPAVLVATIAAATTTLRVGAGGIMLPNHSPRPGPATGRARAGLHPGRIDLGIGRAPGTDGRTALALRRSREALVRQDFEEQLAELRGYVDGFEADHPFAGIAAVPTDVPLPSVWLLGSSEYGADLAAALGTGYAYAGHFGQADPVAVLQAYRTGFTPSAWSSPTRAPHAVLAVGVIVSETAERARELALAATLSTVRLRLGAPGPLPSPEEAAAHRWTLAERNLAGRLEPRPVVGTEREVVPVLADLVQRSGADELMVVTSVHDPAERARSYELLAKGWSSGSVNSSAERVNSGNALSYGA